MKKILLVIALLLFMLSPMAFAAQPSVAYTDPYWDGQGSGRLFIEDGDSALAVMQSIYSYYGDVHAVVQVRTVGGTVLSTVYDNYLQDTDVQTKRLDVTVLPSDYPGPGDYKLVFLLSDSYMQSHNIAPAQSILDFTVTEASENTCPVLNSISSPRHLDVGVEHVIFVLGSDADGDSLTYSAEDLPPGAVFDPVQRKFSWTPTSQDVGQHTVTFRVSDGACSDSQDVNLIVEDHNGSVCDLVFDDPDDVTVDEGQLILIDLDATASKPITFSADNLPDGATFDPVLGLFVWTPSDDQAGEYDVVFTASTGLDCTAQQDVHITVNDVHVQNTCPVASFDWSPDSPQTGATVTFNSTSTDADGDNLTYEWFLNADGSGVPESEDGVFYNVFNTPGSHPVTLRVSDGECQDQTTQFVDVDSSCVLNVVSIDCMDTVVAGQLQSCSVTVDDGNGPVGHATVDLHYPDMSYAGYCMTDPLTGSCTVRFTAPSEPGDYSVHARVQKDGCVPDLDMVPQESFRVVDDGYTIPFIQVYDSSDFSNEKYDFLRGQDLFVMFQVVDALGNPVDNAVTDAYLDVNLDSEPGGRISLVPYEHAPYVPGMYYFWVQIPPTHEFLGPSLVHSVYVDFDDGQGAQNFVGVLIDNNPPEIAHEGDVQAGSTVVFGDHPVTLNVINPVALTATFTVNGEVVGPIAEGHSATLADGAVFHVHDIDFTDSLARVSVTADDYMLDHGFGGDDLQAPMTLDLSEFASDVEDEYPELIWSYTNVSSDSVDVELDGQQLTVTPVSQGCSQFSLELTDLDGAVDSVPVAFCSGLTQPECSDGLDNDGDGLVDLADPGCSDASDDDESDEPVYACSDGIDNDGDGLVDMADPGCANASDDDEYNLLPQCSDTIDNDNDGLVDMEDPGCSSPEDNDESDGSVLPQCSDGLDNDGDGLVDLADPGCVNASDDDEWNLPLPACSDGIDNDGDGLIDMADPDCVSVTDDSEESSALPQCSDGLDNDGDGLVDLADPGCADASDDDEYNAVNTQCSDGLDNDGDGLVDLADPGCSSIYDDSEYNWDTQCSDGVDNDGDGLIDMYDPDCSSPDDNSESPVAPECSDGLDNDGDGLVDLADPDCYDQYDEHEGVYLVPKEPYQFNDQDKLLITRIDIDGHDVEASAVEPGQQLMFSVSVKNVLNISLDDVKVKVFLDDYGLWATKTIHDLESEEDYTADMHIEVPYWLPQGIYDLRITASNDDIRRVKYRQLIVV